VTLGLRPAPPAHPALFHAQLQAQGHKREPASGAAGGRAHGSGGGRSGRRVLGGGPLLGGAAAGLRAGGRDGHQPQARSRPELRALPPITRVHCRLRRVAACDMQRCMRCSISVTDSNSGRSALPVPTRSAADGGQLAELSHHCMCLLVPPHCQGFWLCRVVRWLCERGRAPQGRGSRGPGARGGGSRAGRGHGHGEHGILFAGRRVARAGAAPPCCRPCGPPHGL